MNSIEEKLAEFREQYRRERELERLWNAASRPVQALFYYFEMEYYFIRWNWRSMTKEEATIVWPKEVDKPRKK